ncbi:MAG: peroxidase-related enzyme [Bacteroidota bacterium]
MPYIPLESHLPGITGLLEYRKDTAGPIRELTQVLLRGPSTLTEGERELIATVVSNKNECRFCTAAHTAASDLLLGESETSTGVKENIITAPVSDKMKALLTIASMVTANGKNVTDTVIRKAKDAGATDIEIHDTVLIAALFCLYNRYVDGLATVTPADPSFYQDLGERLKNHGYNRLPQGYDHLNKQTASWKQ